MKVAIKIGGSLAIDDYGPKIEYFRRLIPVVKKVAKKCDKLIIGIGGGKLIRNYYKRIAPFLDKERQEWLAIDLLRANARFLAYVFGGKPVFDLKKIPRSKILTIAGITPGRSTDANAALLAERFGVDLFIILTDVDGIYTKNPKKHKDAILIKEIKFKMLKKLAKKKTSPGNYGVVDPLALKIISRSKIHTFVINGKDPKNIIRVINGENPGTKIN